MPTITLYLCLMLVFFFGCSKLPPSRTTSFSVRLTDDGGMLPVSNQIFISSKFCSLKSSYQQIDNEQTFELPDAVMDSLYQIIYQNKFDCIKTISRKVHDRGGTSIELKINDLTARVSNAGMSFVQSDWTKQYGNVQQAIKNVTRQWLDTHIIRVPVVLDSTLIAKYGSFEIQLNKYAFYSYKVEIDPITTEQIIYLPLLSGDNYLHFNFSQPDAPKTDSPVSFILVKHGVENKGYRLGLMEETNILQLYR